MKQIPQIDFDVVAANLSGDPTIFASPDTVAIPLTRGILRRGLAVRRQHAPTRSEVNDSRHCLEGWIANIDEYGCFAMILGPESRTWLVENRPSLFKDRSESEKATILNSFKPSLLTASLIKEIGEDRAKLIGLNAGAHNPQQLLEYEVIYSQAELIAQLPHLEQKLISGTEIFQKMLDWKNEDGTRKPYWMARMSGFAVMRSIILIGAAGKTLYDLCDKAVEHKAKQSHMRHD